MGQKALWGLSPKGVWHFFQCSASWIGQLSDPKVLSWDKMGGIPMAAFLPISSPPHRVHPAHWAGAGAKVPGALPPHSLAHSPSRCVSCAYAWPDLGPLGSKPKPSSFSPSSDCKPSRINTHFLTLEGIGFLCSRRAACSG